MTGTRTALVTGGGSGIGAAAAVALARDGFRCVVVGRSADTLERTRRLADGASNPVVPWVTDVTDAADRERLVADCRQRFGGVDVLVNCATSTAFEPLLDFAYATWREVLAVNLDACFFLAQATLPDMRAAGWGRIVNVGSVYGQVALDNNVYRERLPADADGRGPVREVAYAAAKGALRQLTRELAVSCARWGVTVNTVVPGMFPGHPKRMPDPLRARLLERIPLGRFGEPHEAAEAIAFLASDRAAYVTGSELVVDGGWTAW
jgi:NAD(P)-dependent dehydrogenase (short-subunit alcohol dehydrogenase family)